MIFGVSATKSAVVVAETSGSGDGFSIFTITSIPFEIRSGEDLADLLRSLAATFDRRDPGAIVTVALLGSSAGRFKSSLEAIKAEALVELAAFQSSLPVVKVTAAGLKKALGGAKDQKWQHRAAELFNPHDEHRPWTQGAAGATSAAYKVAGA